MTLSAIQIRVGPATFDTTLDTIQRDGGMLRSMFKNSTHESHGYSIVPARTDKLGAFLLQGGRDPLSFCYIIKYLDMMKDDDTKNYRSLFADLSLHGLQKLLDEVDYYQLESMETKVRSEIITRKADMIRSEEKCEKHNFAKNPITLKLVQMVMHEEKVPIVSSGVISLDEVRVGEFVKQGSNKEGEIISIDHVNEIVRVHWVDGTWTNETVSWGS